VTVKSLPSGERIAAFLDARGEDREVIASAVGVLPLYIRVVARSE